MKKIILILLAVVAAITIFTSFLALNNNGDARANYEKYCASCHGKNLRTFIDREWVYGNSWNEVFKAIKVGYPNDGMPAYDTAFTDQEITDLVNYILVDIEQFTRQQLKQGPQLSGVIESEELKFSLETVADGFKIPWGMDFLPNGDLLVSERSGTLYRIDNNNKREAIEGVPSVVARGQGGLMDVELHPNFESNKWVYISYSKTDPRNSKLATTAVIRGKLKGNQLTKVGEVFLAEPYLPTRHHYGSKLEFDRDGYLFISVGDRGRRNQNPQSLDNHCGKIHRIHDDGSIPKDNPFVNDNKAKASIFSYGHRNPQGIAMNPTTGQIWETEHGPRGGDEVNIIQKGKNYGWPVISYGINYNGTKFTDLTEQEGLLQPELYWVPSIAPCGTEFVSGNKYPAWEGDLLVGSLSFEYLNRCKVENNKIVGEEKLLKNVGRVRDVEMGPDGYIYVAVEGPGRILKIVPEK
ncbi:MAG: PQQ-dependent sugar dehydrogenase [Bacteroidota bacterium]